jgi:hypothetical protein
MPKGDIIITGNAERDARIEKIATHLGMTKNALIGVVANELSRVPPEHFFSAMAALANYKKNIRT